jgi:hypothetical protein
MRYTKSAVLLAVAAVAIAAFAASASATRITSPTGAVATPTIHAVSEEGAVPGTKHVRIHNSATSIDCNSTFEWTVEGHGTGVTVIGKVTLLQFTGCTNNWTVIVTSAGSLEVHWTSSYNGTVTSSGMTLDATLHTFFGTIHCRYITENTHIGTITGGNPATLHLEATFPFHSGSGLCGSETSRWTGTYITTGSFYVDG